VALVRRLGAGDMVAVGMFFGRTKKKKKKKRLSSQMTDSG
jgi:hypothetical protein